jgi:hypothetical protein
LSAVATYVQCQQQTPDSVRALRSSIVVGGYLLYRWQGTVTLHDVERNLTCLWPWKKTTEYDGALHCTALDDDDNKDGTNTNTPAIDWACLFGVRCQRRRCGNGLDRP